MEKRALHSADTTARNVQKIADMFPHVLTESRGADGEVVQAIDFDLLRQELSDHIVEGPQERYQLDWPGKRAAAFTANSPIAKTLRPVRDESVDFDTTKNLFIEGDNLDALKLLQEPYLGKVKLIYIDPPYNTGNDFVYKDDFAETADEYLLRSGQADEEGTRLVSNTEANGRFHSDWLSMIYPRLKLARSLLRGDGVLLASIDQNEVDSLRKLLDEVFGQQNFVGDFVWAAGRKNDSRFVSTSHEFILAYARDLSELTGVVGQWRRRKDGLTDIYAEYERLRKRHGADHSAVQAGLREWYSTLPADAPARRQNHYRFVDERGIYFADNISWPGGGGPRYEVLHPRTQRPVAIPSRGWLFQKPRLDELIDDDRVHFGPDESSVPTLKSYLRDREFEVPYSVIYKDGRGATKRLRSLMGSAVFTHPKDEEILQDLISFAGSPDGIYLDFFAGSGTTAHAVMQANASDGGTRAFILVQLGEPCEEGSEAAKQGFTTIAEIARERVRRGAQVVKADVGSSCSDLDLGFRAFRVDTTNMADVLRSPDEAQQAQLDLSVESVKPDRSGEDLLFQILLNWGLELTLPIGVETVEGHEVFIVDDGALIACFDKQVNLDVVRAIAELGPLRAVFLDASFATDDARINAEQIFREVSPTTDVKSI